MLYEKQWKVRNRIELRSGSYFQFLPMTCCNFGERPEFLYWSICPVFFFFFFTEDLAISCHPDCPKILRGFVGAKSSFLFDQEGRYLVSSQVYVDKPVEGEFSYFPFQLPQPLFLLPPSTRLQHSLRAPLLSSWAHLVLKIKRSRLPLTGSLLHLTLSSSTTTDISSYFPSLRRVSEGLPLPLVHSVEVFCPTRVSSFSIPFLPPLVSIIPITPSWGELLLDLTATLPSSRCLSTLFYHRLPSLPCSSPVCFCPYLWSIVVISLTYWKDSFKIHHLCWQSQWRMQPSWPVCRFWHYSTVFPSWNTLLLCLWNGTRLVLFHLLTSALSFIGGF